ncbi:type II toxin-antitoxin system HipA family toxin [Hyphobacterium sp. CCMP332]|uniref:type II toxin-antitoxin system HipA family toxin n=1 Tax=Hyphobacterium sp. CCMP332 TaxID=2749086 RepID=UPI00164F43E7|nr:type II toxin-antitoxin system HipA family toxin [Hyphobacterium sp. CCMP332]QNL17900.1 type II toxin-antitoxin system HipA family toxin [Hyphobacterium sp. CCMP332]
MIPVYYETRQVGTITGEGANINFRYNPSWLDEEDPFPVSASLPVTLTEPDSEIATNWFANLLPEEDQLRAFARLNRSHPADLYTLLKKTGRETAGALSIGGPEAAGKYLARSEEELAADIDQLPARPLLAGNEDVGLSLAGAQSKMVIARIDGQIRLPLNGAASTHILKPETHLYASVENEALCMRLAKAIGLDVADVEVGKALQHPYLLVKRYDRVLQDSNSVTRLHQEDAAQALGYSPLQKYEAHGGPKLSDLFRVVDRFSSNRIRDRLELRDRVIFNACIANTDGHAKNFSFLIDQDYKLAPAYDLQTAAPYSNITHNMAIKIGQKRNYRYINRQSWIAFADDCGLAPASTVRRVSYIAATILEKIAAESDKLVAEGQAARAGTDYICSEIVDQTNRILKNLNADQSAGSA